jgi:uncharacterized protein (TIGR01777 family)
MNVFIARSRMAAPAAEVFAWHTRQGAFERLAPPWEKTELLERTGGGVADPGSRVVLRVPVGPFRRRWVAEHKGFEPGHRFEDVQVEGPFAHWHHTHTVEAQGADHCILEDRIEWALPLGGLGSGYAARKLKRVFDYRHALTRGDVERHHALGASPMRIAVTGASGLVGKALVAYLETAGHTVSRLVRGTPGPGDIAWDPARGTVGSLEGQDAVVHLAGEPIAAGRWSDGLKKKILESRVQGTRVLGEALAKLARPPRVLVSASAIGFYGDRGAEDLDEKASRGRGFLADVCHAWEEATAPAKAKGIRVVNLRIGVVLGAAGGALAKMLPPFLMGAGGPVGTGKQVLSWIALDDLLGAIELAIVREELSGPVNGVGPAPLEQAAFAKTLGHVLGRPAFAPLPAFMVRLLFGEMGTELLLAGQRVRPWALESAGFRFRHPTLEGALRFELGRLLPQEEVAPMPLPLATRA